MMSGTEKLLFLPSIFTLMSTNCGSRKNFIVPEEVLWDGIDTYEMEIMSILSIMIRIT